MNKQVLSIDQMQELIELGIDTSKASCYWYGTDETEFVCFGTDMDKDCGNEICPTFTLQDILEMLPPVLGTCTDLEIKFAFGKISYKHPLNCEDTIKFEWDENNILEAAFNMLKWCKQNKHL